MIKRVLHKATVVLLVIGLLFNNINTLVIMGHFLWNQDFIAATLCVQKDNQQGCNGKCHLQKQLAQNDSRSNNQDAPLPENKPQSLDVFCLAKSSTIEIQFIQTLLPKVSVSRNVFKITKTALAVETPPPILS
ncbi:hypothetical protein [Snuella lapsa]|uniref:Transmembrane protein n=1 Tax=Snuella lapsa TaxID=870481 RepID=A0ABP6Y1K5_9FLAO